LRLGVRTGLRGGTGTMKPCYECGGKSGKHIFGCSKHDPNAWLKDRQEKQKEEEEGLNIRTSDTIPPPKNHESDDYMIPMTGIRPIKRLNQHVNSLYTTFLPLEAPVPATKQIQIRNQPHMAVRAKRLWIDETISSFFTIKTIWLGVDGSAFCAFDGSIPANMFRTGNWPMQPGIPSEHQHFGIDLKGWRTLTPGMYFTIEVENISLGQLQFRGCLECEGLRDV